MAPPEALPAVSEEEEPVPFPAVDKGGEPVPKATVRELTTGDLEWLESRLGADNLETLRKKLRGEWRHVQARESREQY